MMGISMYNEKKSTTENLGITEDHPWTNKQPNLSVRSKVKTNMITLTDDES